MAQPGADAEAHGGVTLERADLRPDCARCVGFCCVAPAFAASSDFAITKSAGEPCPNLTTDSLCRIHDELAVRGFRGCVAYECFGAGQRVAQITYAGRGWRGSTNAEAEEMFATFRSVERLSQIAWFLREAAARAVDTARKAEVDRLCNLTEEMMCSSRVQLRNFDLDTHHAEVGDLLRVVSQDLRTQYGQPLERAGGDLAAADLRGQDLRGADLRGACLIRADLRGVDLSLADLLGADMRDSLVADANLSGALFLSQPQLTVAAGSETTQIPEWATRPEPWRSTPVKLARGGAQL